MNLCRYILIVVSEIVSEFDFDIPDQPFTRGCCFFQLKDLFIHCLQSFSEFFIHGLQSFGETFMTMFTTSFRYPSFTMSITPNPIRSVLDWSRSLRPGTWSSSWPPICTISSAMWYTPWCRGAGWRSPSSAQTRCMPLRQPWSSFTFAGSSTWGGLHPSFGSCGGVAVKGECCIATTTLHLCDGEVFVGSQHVETLTSGRGMRALRVITCEQFDPCPGCCRIVDPYVPWSSMDSHGHSGRRTSFRLLRRLEPIGHWQAHQYYFA